jgi:hypothetical protein
MYVYSYIKIVYVGLKAHYHQTGEAGQCKVAQIGEAKYPHRMGMVAVSSG